MTPRLRKLGLTAHLTSAMGWLGADLGFLALALVGLASQDAQRVRAAYLAMGRPVVVQDNGLIGVLPTGEGLFSVRSVDEAAGALDAIQSEPARHQKAARALAVEYLDTNRVLGRFLTEVGIH